VQALIAEVAAIQKQIEGFTTTLSNADRVATTKMRPGGENIVATLAQLADQQGIELPAATGGDVTASLTLAQRLKPLADASRQLTRRLDDTMLKARGECWWSATALYTALARVATSTPELEAALAPVVAFFALGKRKKPQPPTPSTPPSSSTPPIKSAA
jgi:hypothetical protein